MLISAIRYHQISDEIWLDSPRPDLGGMTFREKLLSYHDFNDRLEFEIDTFMGDEIGRMASFEDRPDSVAVFRTVRYEDLIADTQMTLFHELCIHLALDGQDLIYAMQAFWNQSIFGGMSDVRKSGMQGHIRHGGAEQWRAELDASSIRLIQDRIGGAIEKLGYPLV